MPTDSAEISGATAAPLPPPAPAGGPRRYLNIFWNQHQPYYKDEARDEFTQPWVRLHSTKDYYDMAAELLDFPNVHCTINLSSSLLRQLDEYVEKLHDFGDVESPRRGQRDAYPMGHVDRYMDLLVKPVDQWSDEERTFASDRFFDADPAGQIASFPRYKALADKKARGERFSDDDLRDLKVLFHLAWMDPIFREGDVKLVGDTVDGKPMQPEESVTAIDDITRKGSGFSEDDAMQVALETYKIMKYVVPIHRHMQNRVAPDGKPQVEVVTTPFYHPILPLLHDTRLAQQAVPGLPLPNPGFNAPSDAYAQVAKGAAYYEKLFGRPPRGMWPGEGSVAEEVVQAFHDNGVKWIATGNEVAERSGYFGDTGLMYRIDGDKTYLDGNNADAMSIVFRSLHDKIGFDYGENKGFQDGSWAAENFLHNIRSWNHFNNVPHQTDALVTNTADGENCWQNYKRDGHDFLRWMYGQLNEGGNGIATTTPEAYMVDHPLDKQWELEPLAAGSWVGGDFTTWIGEPSENDAWERLRIVRDSLVNAGVPQPDPRAPMPDPSADRKKYFEWKAWEALYAAEGSDWFWWYGNDQGDNGPSDARFADGHRTHMLNVYAFAEKAGYDLPYPARMREPLDVSTRVIEVPPLTRQPRAEPKDGALDLSIDAFMPKEDAQKIASVTVDLRPFGGAEDTSMELGKDGRWHARTGTPTKGALLTVTARTDKGTASQDFIRVGR